MVGEVGQDYLDDDYIGQSLSISLQARMAQSADEAVCAENDILWRHQGLGDIRWLLEAHVKGRDACPTCRSKRPIALARESGFTFSRFPCVRQQSCPLRHPGARRGGLCEA